MIEISCHKYRIIDSGDGFTLMEAIIVILIAGIVAAFVTPRLDLGAFRETGFVQQATAAIRYAQKRAVTTGCNVNVSISPSGCNISWTGTPPGPGCVAGNIPNPSTGSSEFCNQATAPAGTATTSFTFDNIGRPTGGTQTLVLGSRTLTVEAETGYVHE